MLKRLFILTFFMISFTLISCSPPRETVDTKGNEGLLAIYCEPNTASVYVDGVLQGETKQFDGRPGFLKLSPGTHNIKIEKEGYKPYRTQVYISDAKETIECKLQEK